MLLTHARDSPRDHGAPRDWHATPADGLWTALGSSAEGLSDEEAAARLTTYGPNSLPRPAGVSALTILAAQLRSIVVLLLVGATVVSIAIGDWIEAAAIAAVLLINTALGFLTEWRARRAMEALLQLQAPRATVVRSGRLQVIDATAVVAGDIVQLDAGNTIPADVRLIMTAEFSTDEAALTGESLPVEKIPDLVLEADTPLADRKNMAYMGTTAATGTALAVVIATGAATELGRIGELVSTVGEQATPLEQRLDALGRRLAWLTLAIAGFVASVDLAQGAPLGLVLQTGIALAVAAIPEALPAVATIALAVGMHRMARRHALVRRLPSVETLGSTTVVCADKTRTLTSGNMTVVRIWTGSGEYALTSDEPLVVDGPVANIIDIAALASQPQAAGDGGQQTIGNPADLAVLDALSRRGTQRADLIAGRPARALLPFSSTRKFMASLHDVNGTLVAFVKGAPSRVLARSGSMRLPTGVRPLIDEDRARLVAINERLARSGLRVLAVASGPVSDASEASLQGLTFEGFLGLADPVAGGVIATIARLRRAGLQTVMITGDQRATAEAVGREIGLVDEGADVIDGRQLDQIGTQDLAEQIRSVTVFSRVSPEHKLRIVSALQQRGEIVAMLGDGVNDAAALKRADVGVAMGIRGTDVAKQAAAIVLQDDRFETVAAAVEEGRVIFDNIRKFVFYLFSCNVAEILVLLVAALGGMPLPVQPLQLLWLNMVTDTFPALSLAMEPGDATVMSRPPRDPKEAILSRSFLGSVAIYAAAITACTLTAFIWGLMAAPEAAPTMAFMTLGLAQIGHLGNARSAAAVLAPARALGNGFALAGVGLAGVLQLATTMGPLARILDVAPLGPRQWLVVLVCAAMPAVAGQIYKVVRPPAP